MTSLTVLANRIRDTGLQDRIIAIGVVHGHSGHRQITELRMHDQANAAVWVVFGGLRHAAHYTYNFDMYLLKHQRRCTC